MPKLVPLKVTTWRVSNVVKIIFVKMSHLFCIVISACSLEQLLSEIEEKFAESERNVCSKGQPSWGDQASASLLRPRSNTLSLEQPRGARVQRLQAVLGRGDPLGHERGVTDLGPTVGNGGDCFHTPRQDDALLREDSCLKTGESASSSVSAAVPVSRESVFSAQLSEGVPLYMLCVACSLVLHCLFFQSR